ncbi:MAG: Transcription termination/antitermination protein NusA [Dehalococcoidia bacterium]|nr:Transcription termination/antitermination protein NusA [Chloroflexota bacterium]
MRVETDLAEAAAVVVVPDGQLSLAIGKEGQNARLAAKLTGWKIDIKSARVAEEEMVARMADEKALAQEIGEPSEGVEEAAEEIVEEIIPIEAVIAVESTVPEGTQIRFAEDILPQAVRDRTAAEKSRKDLADDKLREKKKARRVKPLPDEVEHEDEVEDNEY